MGNETIRWNAAQNWLEIWRLALLARLANRPHGRYRLSCLVDFPYRGGDVAAQAATGAVRYNISQDPARGRWYLDASWKTPTPPPVTLAHAWQGTVIAVDVNAAARGQGRERPGRRPARGRRGRRPGDP